WNDAWSRHSVTERGALVTRTSRETRIECEVRLDHGRAIDVRAGLPFLDHMLEQTARYGAFDLVLRGEGDLKVDPHHLVEDTGIVLGQAVSRALGDRAGITRFPTAHRP